MIVCDFTSGFRRGRCGCPADAWSWSSSSCPSNHGPGANLIVTSCAIRFGDAVVPLDADDRRERAEVRLGR